MGTPRFTPESKGEAVRQITERGYSVATASHQLSLYELQLYTWRSNKLILSSNSEHAIK